MGVCPCCVNYDGPPTAAASWRKRPLELDDSFASAPDAASRFCYLQSSQAEDTEFLVEELAKNSMMLDSGYLG